MMMMMMMIIEEDYELSVNRRKHCPFVCLSICFLSVLKSSQLDIWIDILNIHLPYSTVR